MKKYFSTIYKPVIVLVSICIVVSLALAGTNYLTAPIIADAERRAANAGRLELIPDATDFEKLECTTEGVVEFYKSTNDVGFVVTATAKGYGGDIPVMVGFTTDGKIIAINVLTNSETPGLGKKVEEPAFKDQFAGMAAENFTLADIDAISGATISSAAVTSAVNIAIEAYNEIALGVVAVEKTSAEKCAELLPQSGVFTQRTDATMAENIIDITADGATKSYALKATEFWLAENGDSVVFAEGIAYYDKPIYIMVAYDINGTIIAVNVDASLQTQGLGSKVGDAEYTSQFISKTIPIEGIDIMAKATVSSTVTNELVKLSEIVFVQNNAATDPDGIDPAIEIEGGEG